MDRWSARDVRARRLARHALTASPPDPTPAGVVRAMHGAHAQVPSAAELSVALRLPGSTRVTVRHAVTVDRSLTRTFGPRGTVHLLPTADLPMWTGALSAAPRPRSPFPAGVRLEDAQLEEVVAALADATLAGELTLEELDAAVVARTGPWAGEPVMPAFATFWPRWRQAIGVAAHRGALVHGVDRGRAVTYTSPRLADPGFAPAPAPAALAGFLHGYLAAYGPATPAQLARWLNLPADWTADLFARTGDAVEPVLVGDTTAWVNAGDTARQPLGRSVRLLPYFDALQVGFAPRELMFPGRAAERALARGQAGNYPVLVVDGAVVGVWHARRSGRRVHVTVETWLSLSAQRRRRLEEQVDRVGEVLEATPTLTLGQVTVGPHA